MLKLKLKSGKGGKSLKLKRGKVGTDIKPQPPKEEKRYANLRDIMDYTRPFAMFYSGVESETYFNGCYDMGVRNFLMSYEYTRGRNITEKYKDSGISLFIDSGAFTYMNDPKYVEYTPEQWEKQIMSYLKWAESHKDMIFAIANLDLEYLVGPEVVNAWNKKYFEPFMLRTGLPVCFIYHKEVQTMTWEQWCQRYPYVGISFTTDTSSVAEGMEYLKIAEKYNTLVQGMGMTKTSILPQLPFYTVDSTSWKSGFRYGQLAIFNGKKVQMFKKDEWETKAFRYTRNYDIHPPLDEQKLYDFYEPEVLRANVFAYQKAEEYIVEALKSKMYWFKKRVTKVDLDNLPEGYLPSPEVFENKDKDKMLSYCEKLNINPDYQMAASYVAMMTAFLTKNDPAYDSLREYCFGNEQFIEETHDLLINRIVPDMETKIADLEKFFLECASGNNDKLLQLGTNFDRIAREREEYITDEEEEGEELVDLTPYQVREKLSQVMSIPMENISEKDPLDEEIYSKANIVPTFDERGKFVKGQVAVRKPKNLYSKKYPKFACDTCYAAAKCPEFRSGYVCAYNKMFSRFSTRNSQDIMEAMQGMADHNLARMQRAMVLETISGIPDPQVTSFIDQNMRLLSMIRQMQMSTNPALLKHTRILRADGTEENTLQVSNVNPSSSSILSKLFTPQNKDEMEEDEEVKETLDVEAKPV